MNVHHARSQVWARTSIARIGIISARPSVNTGDIFYGNEKIIFVWITRFQLPKFITSFIAY